MAPYLLDTNHAGTLLRDAKAPLWGRLSTLNRAECAPCRPVVGELWFMVYNSERVESNRPKLQDLLRQFDIWEFDAPCGEEYGKLRAELRRKGKPVPSFDVLIAAIARVNGATLLTADRHFQHVGGLPVENWLETST